MSTLQFSSHIWGDSVFFQALPLSLTPPHLSPPGLANFCSIFRPYLKCYSPAGGLPDPPSGSVPSVPSSHSTESLPVEHTPDFNFRTLCVTCSSEFLSSARQTVSATGQRPWLASRCPPSPYLEWWRLRKIASVLLLTCPN